MSIVELIAEYKEMGYSSQDAALMAKAKFLEMKQTLKESNEDAELNRIKNCSQTNNKYSVVYGARKGVM